MKHIVKRDPPAAFESWKALENADWTPTYSNLQNPEKRLLHDSLLSEQGWLCCYCGRRIGLNDSHIEHFRPRESRGDLELEYLNLHASCVRETRPREPPHCGHAKGSVFREDQYVSPLSPDCEGRFIYTLDDRTVSG